MNNENSTVDDIIEIIDEKIDERIDEKIDEKVDERISKRINERINEKINKKINQNIKDISNQRIDKIDRKIDLLSDEIDESNDRIKKSTMKQTELSEMIETDHQSNEVNSKINDQNSKINDQNSKINDQNSKINDQNRNLLDESIYEFNRNILNDLDTCSSSETNDRNHILYVLVVGFHHKKGCQIDYCYPSMNNEFDLDQNRSPTNKLPNIWKTLPSIALPDGSHNYDRDTIYFHLPHPKNTQKTIFGISCYKQISAEQLKEKDEDVTRGTVQKSVVVLSELPLYGLIAVKCEMITTLYFKECDFSKTDCLKELYFNLNSILVKDLLTTSEVFLGLSPRDLVLAFTHKIIILFKLILLEKKVLFFIHKSPVKDLCTSILTLISLFPGMLEQSGLDYSSTNVQQKQDKDRKFSADIELIDEELIITQEASSDDDDKSNSIMLVDECGKNNLSIFYTNNKLASIDDKTSTPIKEAIEAEEAEETISTNHVNKNESKEDDPFLMYRDEDSINPKYFCLGDENYTPLLFKLSLKDCGFPLNIFRKGSYCHPYLSLAYLDILSDQRVRSFVIGATNYLFKQKRHLFDVIVELDSAKIDIIDNDLKKKLQLSTEDLRFADYLVKCIEENGAKGESTKLFDNTNWLGGDEWLRYQFKIYLIQLLITSKSSENSKEYHSFNSLFMNSWKETENYRRWLNLNLNAFESISPGHPFYGQLSIADMKLRFNHAINNTERGKKINQTVVQTGKAVGSALTNAKSAVYSWWSTLGKNAVNNLDLDKNSTITSSDTNLSISHNGESISTTSKSMNSTIGGLKLSNSFTSFTLSSLIKASEESVSSAISTIKSDRQDDKKSESKIDTV